jgi:hypothetical protein
MDLAELKSTIQQHMSDGLVLIVGSGLSCAEGLPGMSDLAVRLASSVGPKLTPTLLLEWNTLLSKIGAVGLETAFADQSPSGELEEIIRKEVGDFIASCEMSVVTEVFQGKRTLRLTRLLKHLLRPTNGIQVVTTNYDCLVEVAAEEAGLGVDTMFNGVFAARLSEKETRMSFCRNVTLHNKTGVRYHYAEHVVINKPHGSLDWYDRNGTPVRHCGELPDATRLILPPGRNKYRDGYSSPFDLHRERANKAIDRASRFLIIGYGFNDDHLETHLATKIKSGVPTILLTHTLSPKARAVLNFSSQVMALEDATSAGAPATRVYRDGAKDVFNGLQLWDINNLVSEVFEP